MLTMFGDFTNWKYLKDINPRQFELHVGFDGGRLRDGFAVVVLDPNTKIAPSDFILGGSTRWSNNQIGKSGDPMETVLSNRGSDVNALRNKVADFLNKGGDNTPAKVIPNRAHLPGMTYPNANVLTAEFYNGIPSYKFVVPKRAILARLFGPNYRLAQHRHAGLPANLR